jgi:hypothetical protein
MTMATAYNPNDYTVDEVNAYVADHPDEAEAVKAAEREGKARKGILDAGEPAPEQGDANGTADTTTKGQTFAEAAEAVQHQEEVGSVGTSPERERTGRADKGLSQQAPGILDNSVPAPDPRPNVDDSETIDRLKSEDEG